MRCLILTALLVLAIVPAQGIPIDIEGDGFQVSTHGQIGGSTDPQGQSGINRLYNAYMRRRAVTEFGVTDTSDNGHTNVNINVNVASQSNAEPPKKNTKIATINGGQAQSVAIPFAGNRLGTAVEYSGICEKTTPEACDALMAQQLQRTNITVP